VKGRKRTPDPKDDTSTRDPKSLIATSLYQTLEAALAARGISRPPSLPPLRHAMELAQRRHPLAPEVLALTEVYLDSRCGHHALSDGDIRAFERGVRDVRQRPLEASKRGPHLAR
jgi:hypothetical protein